MENLVYILLKREFMNEVIFPGTFDPITVGHLEIIERLSQVYHKVYVVISVNHKKNPYFALEKRKDFIINACEHLNNIEVLYSDKLIVRLANEIKCNIIARGVRHVHDFTSEQQLAYSNLNLDGTVQTILLISKPEHSHISSSGVKELISFNEEIKGYVPEYVNRYYLENIKEENVT